MTEPSDTITDETNDAYWRAHRDGENCRDVTWSAAFEHVAFDTYGVSLEAYDTPEGALRALIKAVRLQDEREFAAKLMRASNITPPDQGVRS